MKLKKIIFFTFVTLFLQSACSYNKNIAPPSFPLSLPQDISFISLEKTVQNEKVSKMREAFISIGKNWRVEADKPGKKTTVIIYSNGTFGSSSKKEVRDIKVFDVRNHIRKGYSELSKDNYKGIKKINKYNCWYFVVREDDITIEMWIDTEKQIPRKWTITMSDFKQTKLFFDLPNDIKIHYEEIFNLKNLESQIINKARLNWNNVKI